MAKQHNPPRPDTLIIVYMDGNKEGFRNVKDLAAVEKIVSRRNATTIQSATYGGEAYDISKHQKIYHENRSEQLSKKVHKEANNY